MDGLLGAGDRGVLAGAEGGDLGGALACLSHRIHEGGVVSGRRAEERRLGAYTWQFDTAITAFWGRSSLLDVKVAEIAAGGFDDADFVGAGVVAVVGQYWRS